MRAHATNLMNLNVTKCVLKQFPCMLAGGLNAVICEVLPVSAKFADQWLDERAKSLVPGQPIIWVGLVARHAFCT